MRKIRQNIITLLLFVGMLLQVSCDNWLDVGPETEVPKKDLFTNQGGFQDALIGSYIRMKSNDLYGGRLVWEDIEYLAQHWEFAVKSVGEAYNQYDYKNKKVEPIIGNIYNNLYKVIADVNAILSSIDAKQSIFDDGRYDLIKGEALAIRAFCHFDILRLFGPMPQKANENTGTILPYVKIVDRNAHPYHSYADFTAFLLADLNAAEQCLEKVDPIRDVPIGTNVEDDFLTSRHMRMNYNAVLALKARVYLWLQDKDNALIYARKVIEAKNNGGSNQYRLGNENDMLEKDYIFSKECVLGIYAQGLEKTAKDKFMESGSNYQMRREELNANLYPEGTSDLRYRLWRDLQSPGNPVMRTVIAKYWQEAKSTLALKTIPLIRLSEMYLIVMECAPSEEANLRYKEFCDTRLVAYSALPTYREDLTKLLMSEYHKEFYAEGQTFYAYKRLGVSTIFWTSVKGSEETYVLPLPAREIINN